MRDVSGEVRSKWPKLNIDEYQNCRGWVLIRITCEVAMARIRRVRRFTVRLRLLGLAAAVFALAASGVSGIPAIASAAPGRSAPPALPAMPAATKVGVLKPPAPRPAAPLPESVPAGTSWPSAGSAI